MELKDEIFANPKKFVDKYSSLYDNHLYEENIDKGLDNYESFYQLFKWKNGGMRLSQDKGKLVEEFWDKIEMIRVLKTSFNWDTFEKEFNPQKSACIWKIFLLHIINPKEFPIFDQHVFRFQCFVKNRTINEIPSTHKKKYEHYKKDYRIWFIELQNKHSLDPRKMDESFFYFGKKIKTISKTTEENNVLNCIIKCFKVQ